MQPRSQPQSGDLYAGLYGEIDAGYRASQAELDPVLSADLGRMSSSLSRDAAVARDMRMMDLDLSQSLAANNTALDKVLRNIRPPAVVATEPDPMLTALQGNLVRAWRQGVQDVSYSGIDQQFADGFDRGLYGAPTQRSVPVPAQSLSDFVYLPGPIPPARYNLGIASLAVNGGLNLINGVANGVLNSVEALTEPLDRYQGELISMESGLGPMGMAAVAPTLLLGRLSSVVRAEDALNAGLLRKGQLALEAEQASIAQKISFEPSLTSVDRYFGMQAGEIMAADPTARAIYTRLQAQGTDIRFANGSLGKRHAETVCTSES